MSHLTGDHSITIHINEKEAARLMKILVAMQEVQAGNDRLSIWVEDEKTMAHLTDLEVDKHWDEYEEEFLHGSEYRIAFNEEEWTEPDRQDAAEQGERERGGFGG